MIVITGCRTMVVFAHGVRKAWVRFPAARQFKTRRI